MNICFYTPSTHHNSHPPGPLHPPFPNHNTLFQIYPLWQTICLFRLLVPNFKKAMQIQNFHPFWHNLIPNFISKSGSLHHQKSNKNITKVFERNQKKKKKTPINKSKVMSLFYILTGPTLSLLVTLTDSFPSNSKPSLYTLGLARPHLSSIFLLFSTAFKVQSMSHFCQAPCRWNSEYFCFSILPRLGHHISCVAS